MPIRSATLVLLLLHGIPAASAQFEEPFQIFDDVICIDVTAQQEEELTQLENEFSELLELIDTSQNKLISQEYERDILMEGVLTPEQKAELAKARTTERNKKATALAKFLKQFAFLSASMARADDLILFEGLPRGSDEQLNEIKSNHTTIEIDGWSFYEEPRVLSPAVEYQLRKTLMDYTAFEPYGGPKFCGGFHPDFAVQWSDGDKKYSALVCLTCFEVNYILPNGETIFDFRATAWKRFALVCLSTFKEHKDTIEKLDRTIGS